MGDEVKILVVGAAGNLGWFLCKDLVQNSNDVFALVRPGRDVPDGCVKIEMELREINLEVLPRVDAVVYLAKSKHFRDFPDQWEDIFDINIRITLLLANWARVNGAKGFHYASSGGVYESGVVAVRENAEINVNRDTDFYVASRLSAEVLLRNYASSFESFSLIRPFFIYGPAQARSMLIPRLVDNVRQGREITLVGNEGLKINPIHVTDAAAAVSKLLTIKGFHALNIAGGEVLTLRQIVQTIGHALGKEPILKIKAGESGELVGDISKMTELLIEPRIKFRDGIRDLL